MFRHAWQCNQIRSKSDVDAGIDRSFFTSVLKEPKLETNWPVHQADVVH